MKTRILVSQFLCNCPAHCCYLSFQRCQGAKLLGLVAVRDPASRSILPVGTLGPGEAPCLGFRTQRQHCAYSRCSMLVGLSGLAAISEVKVPAQSSTAVAVPGPLISGQTSPSQPLVAGAGGTPSMKTPRAVFLSLFLPSLHFSAPQFPPLLCGSPCTNLMALWQLLLPPPTHGCHWAVPHVITSAHSSRCGAPITAIQF